MRLVRSARGGSGRAAGMDGIVSTSPGSGTRGGSGRGNEGLGRGKGSGGSFGSGLGIGGLCGAGGSGLRVGGLRGAGGSGLGVGGLRGAGGLCGAGGSGRGSGSARGGASSQDDDVCEAIHAPVGGVGAEADGDAGPTGFIGGVVGNACPRRAEARRRVGTSRVEREEERGSGVGEEGGVCAAGAAGRWVG